MKITIDIPIHIDAVRIEKSKKFDGTFTVTAFKGNKWFCSTFSAQYLYDQSMKPLLDDVLTNIFKELE